MATTTTPAIANTATTAELSAHQAAVQANIQSVEAEIKSGATITADKAQQLANDFAQLTNGWIDKKHANTRLLEVLAGSAVLFFVLGVLVGSHL